MHDAYPGIREENDSLNLRLNALLYVAGCRDLKMSIIRSADQKTEILLGGEDKTTVYIPENEHDFSRLELDLCHEFAHLNRSLQRKESAMEIYRQRLANLKERFKPNESLLFQLIVNQTEDFTDIYHLINDEKYANSGLVPDLFIREKKLVERIVAQAKSPRQLFFHAYYLKMLEGAGYIYSRRIKKKLEGIEIELPPSHLAALCNNSTGYLCELYISYKVILQFASYINDKDEIDEDILEEIWHYMVTGAVKRGKSRRRQRGGGKRLTDDCFDGGITPWETSTSIIPPLSFYNEENMTALMDSYSKESLKKENEYGFRGVPRSSSLVRLSLLAEPFVCKGIEEMKKKHFQSSSIDFYIQDLIVVFNPLTSYEPVTEQELEGMCNLIADTFLEFSMNGTRKTEIIYHSVYGFGHIPVDNHDFIAFSVRHSYEKSQAIVDNRGLLLRYLRDTLLFSCYILSPVCREEDLETHFYYRHNFFKRIQENIVFLSLKHHSVYQELCKTNFLYYKSSSRIHYRCLEQDGKP